MGWGIMWRPPAQFKWAAVRQPRTGEPWRNAVESQTNENQIVVVTADLHYLPLPYLTTASEIPKLPTTEVYISDPELTQGCINIGS